MKFQFLTLSLVAVLLFCQHTRTMEVDRTSISLNKRDVASSAVINNNSHDVFSVNKRCGGHDDVDCLLDSVMDLLSSILGGGGGGGDHYDGDVVGVVHSLVKAVRQLLHSIGLHGGHHHGAGGLDGLLGSLLGGHHHFDDGDDFGCGCHGDDLVDHLIKIIHGLLDQLAGCETGLIPQLVDAVNDLLESLVHEDGHYHKKDGHGEGHQGGHGSGKHQGEHDADEHHQGGHDADEHHQGEHGNKHHGDCSDGLLGLDCLLDTVVDLINSLISGDNHGHQSHGHQDTDVSDLVTQVEQLLRHLLDALDLNISVTWTEGLDLHLGGDNDNDFGCGCDGDQDALISHLIKSLEHVLDQLAGCDDDNRGLIGKLITTVKHLLEALESKKHDHDVRQRFDVRRRRKQRTTHHGGLDLKLVEGVLDTIEELLDRLLGECDDSLLGQIKDLVERILEGIKRILACLRKGLLNDLLHLVRALVDDVVELLTRCDGDSELDHILDELVHAVKSLVSGCDLLGLIDLHRLVLHL